MTYMAWNVHKYVYMYLYTKIYIKFVCVFSLSWRESEKANKTSIFISLDEMLIMIFYEPFILETETL